MLIIVKFAHLIRLLLLIILVSHALKIVQFVKINILAKVASVGTMFLKTVRVNFVNLLVSDAMIRITVMSVRDHYMFLMESVFLVHRIVRFV